MEIAKLTAPQDWEYFAKGAANILFKYTGDNDYLKHRLMRARLAKDTDEYISTCELYDFLELKCKRLFPDNIIDVQLIVLDPDFVANLDSNGNQLMMSERYGLLIPNMLAGSYERYSLSKHCQLYVDTHQPAQSVIFEIKPKWLYDNTTTNYCRTCSLNQFRNYERHFCPLDLLYPHTVSRGLADLFAHIPENVSSQLKEEKFPLQKLFEAFLSRPNNVFLKLKTFQEINDKSDQIKNLQSSDDVSATLSLIMTLRDVGLFIRFERYDKNNDLHNSHNNVENLLDVAEYGKFLITCNIYDLDLKSQMKYKHWQSTEEKLAPIYNSENPNWPFCVRNTGGNTFET
ncbi:inositol-pentakisphosphate 2-kinase [Diutina catenulata]